jgi:hypothetical protein
MACPPKQMFCEQRLTQPSPGLTIRSSPYLSANPYLSGADIEQTE